MKWNKKNELYIEYNMREKESHLKWAIEYNRPY